MKKILTLLSLTLVLVLGTKAQETTPMTVEADPNAPIITFESTTVDYGNIMQNDNGVRFFKFTNTGKSELIITSCKGSCGCTVPQCPKTPIMPGESGEIQVKYDTKRIGTISKTVTVRTNASNSMVLLKIKGNIAPAPKEDAFPVNQTPGAPVE